MNIWVVHHHHNPAGRCFPHPQCSLMAFISPLPSSAPGNCRCISRPINLSFLDILWEWTHEACGFFPSASFFWVYSCCNGYLYLILFIAEQNFTVYTCCSSPHFLMDIYLGCNWPEAIMNSTAINSHMHVCAWPCFHFCQIEIFKYIITSVALWMVMESFEYRHHLNPEHFCHSKRKSHPISKQSLPASPFPWRPLSHFLFLFSCLLGTFPVLVIFLISFCVLVLMGDERNQPLWSFVTDSFRSALFISRFITYCVTILFLVLRF